MSKEMVVQYVNTMTSLCLQKLERKNYNYNYNSIL